MRSAARTKATEERLDEIRTAASESTKATETIQHPSGSRSLEGTYYSLPALKAPPWTWQVPLYFFIGGIAGMSGCIAFIAQLFRSEAGLIRVSLWTALLGAAICPALLIADLGKPTRFLNMLRVFKFRSAMSLGAWILVAFSGCAFLAVFCFEFLVRGSTSPVLMAMLWLDRKSVV